MTNIVVLGLELFGVLAFMFALDRTWDKNDRDEEEK